MSPSVIASKSSWGDTPATFIAENAAARFKPLAARGRSATTCRATSAHEGISGSGGPLGQRRVRLGDDLRGLPLIERKRRRGRPIGKTKNRRAIQYGEHLKGNGASALAYVSRLGLEGIVSKRVDAPYRSGPSNTRLNPASEAVRRVRP